MEKLIRGEFVKYMIAENGYWGDKPGSTAQIVHDGDTVNIFAKGNIAIRFLGIDTPEISLNIKKGKQFFSTGSAQWKQYLDNIQTEWPRMEADLGTPLFQYVMGRIANADAAGNQHTHAKAAEKGLEELIREDEKRYSRNEGGFSFFTAMAYEFFDGYGRLLAYVHPNDPKGKPQSYNERMLEKGLAHPYFIWPNVNPYRREASVVAAAYANPGDLLKKANGDPTLNAARTAVKNARNGKLGIFDAQNPVILEPFELRMLSRQEKPSRMFIDLTGTLNKGKLINAEEYYKVNPEDRLFVPDQYVPLFRQLGW